jgi:hypothetical protein
MSVLCIQIQPSRAPGINLAFIRDAAAQLGATALFTQYGEEEGFDEGTHINLYFDAPSPAEAWPVIHSTFYDDVRLCEMLRKLSIATCQGQAGWDDYLLLHHFDTTLFLDKF